jgi:YHS domain-containing protein
MRSIKSFSLVLFCLFSLLSFTGAALAAPQTECPVMGGKINKKIYVDYKGQRIYFCCSSCPATFKADPEKYLAKLKEMGQEPEQLEQGDTKDEQTQAPDTMDMDQQDHQEHESKE